MELSGGILWVNDDQELSKMPKMVFKQNWLKYCIDVDVF